MKSFELPAPGKSTVLKKKSDTNDVVQAMLQIIRKCADDEQIQALAQVLQDSKLSHLELCNILLSFAYKSVFYQATPANIQQVKTPFRSLQDAKGNCVDYSILIGSLLKSCGVPCSLRIVQLPGQDGFAHVYVVSDGVVIDPVIYQKEDGREHLTRLNGIRLEPGRECEYESKLDFLI